MSDNHQDQSREPIDLRLAREIRDLDREIQPTRDLWSGIERRIADYPQRRLWNSLMPWGIAASLLIAVTSLVISLNREMPLPSIPLNTSLDNLEAEYMRVRNPMVEQFNQANSNLDPTTLNELYRNIEIMEKARKEIEAQIRENPENRRLVEMLMRIHEQELELLQEDYTRPGRTM